MNQDILSKNLKRLRKMLNLTQDEFAENLSITGSYISDVERGKSVISDSVLCLMEINYRINRDWLLKDEGEPFVKEWLDNKLNLFEENGGPILDNFKMELEVVYGPNDPRRSAGAKVYNIDQSAPSNASNVSTPSISYNQPPAADPWQETLHMARQVLESGTDHAGLLASNIKLSFNTIQDKKLLEEKCNTALNEIEKLKQQNSTGRGKVEDSDAAQAVGS
jgi:transcriptional regulator with XRE-family HTH domain